MCLLLDALPLSLPVKKGDLFLVFISTAYQTAELPGLLAEITFKKLSLQPRFTHRFIRGLIRLLLLVV